MSINFPYYKHPQKLTNAAYSTDYTVSQTIPSSQVISHLLSLVALPEKDFEVIARGLDFDPYATLVELLNEEVGRNNE